MSTLTQWHWNFLPSVILIEILSYLPLIDKINACSTCKAWRSSLFYPNFWRKIELVFKNGDTNGLERSRFIASWGTKKLRSCLLKFESTNSICLVETDHVLMKLARNPQVIIFLFNFVAMKICQKDQLINWHWTVKVINESFLPFSQDYFLLIINWQCNLLLFSWIICYLYAISIKYNENYNILLMIIPLYKQLVLQD